MRKMAARNVLILVAVLVVIALLVGNRMWQQARKPVSQSISELQSQKGIPVSIDTVGLGNVSESLQLTGTVLGIAQSDLISKIAERVVRVHANVGESVKKGAILVVFDTSNPMAQYRQAKTALDNAERDFARMKALLEQGAISRQMFDQTESGLEVARANFEAARSMVEITAPIDGVVTAMNVHEGEVVPAGHAVCTVARVDRVKVIAQASEVEVRKLSVGAASVIRASEGREIAGTVSSISSSADPGTRTFRVEVTADNSQGHLRAGAFATVTVQTANRQNVLVVPVHCVITREGRQAVFVASDDGTAQLRRVKTGVTNSQHTEILEGLKQGDRIVIKGYELLKGGEKISVVGAE
ncbi:MAG: efflux RND transporter periplasmic adaptor subunit [Candidatus Eisenbacteria bacterium]